jgi:hypothetical protein
LITARGYFAGAGTQNAGLVMGGTGPLSCTEEYNGTSWSAGGALAQAVYAPTGAGTQNAGLVVGGLTSVVISCTGEYNGITWSVGGALAIGSYGSAGAGTQDAGLVTGGIISTSLNSSTEEYNKPLQIFDCFL